MWKVVNSKLNKWRAVVALHGNDEPLMIMSLRDNCWNDHFNDRSLFTNVSPFIKEAMMNIPLDSDNFRFESFNIQLNRWLSVAVIVDDLVYEVCKGYISLYDLNSNERIRQIFVTDLNNYCTFKDDVFFYTKRDIYLLDNKGQRLIWILTMEEHVSLPVVFVLAKDERSITFVLQDFDRTVEIFTYTNQTESCTAIETFKVPPNLHLCGCHEGLLYFVSFHSITPFYAIYSGKEEINRRYLNCNRIQDSRISNGLLSCTVLIHETHFLVIIDLNSDALLFTRSFEDCGLKNGYRCPNVVIGKRSKFHSCE